ncbi:MAG: type IX secretion system membrane protein PorP/SprF [Saprospiraceae bacterium]
MRNLLTYLFLLAACRLLAQDPVFSQFYAMPLQLNPGFAGSADAPRVGIIYRNQWTGFDNAYRTYAVSYEQSLDRLNSGIGFNLLGDNAGNGIYKVNRFSGVYAYRLNITDAFNIRLGVEAGLHQTTLDWEKLLFPDQLDPIDGPVYSTGELSPEITSRTRFDVSAGMLLLGERWYAGLALKHLNTPNEGILLINDNLSRGLPLLYNLHGGIDILVKPGNKRREASFLSPNFLFVAQGPYKQLNLGAYGSFGSFYGGLWIRHTFRNSDAAILLAGFRQGILKIGLSYDFTVSGLAANAGGTYELSIGIQLPGSHRKYDLNNCLRMFQ